MAADRVSRWRVEIDGMTDEASSNSDPNVKVSKRSRIVELLTDVVSKTNDAADKEQLALAKEQLYHAHLALLALEGITEAQRNASDRFVALYEDTVRARLPGPQQQQRGPRTQLPIRRWRMWQCLGGYEAERSDDAPSTSPRSSLGGTDGEGSEASDQSAAAPVDAQALIALSQAAPLQLQHPAAAAPASLPQRALEVAAADGLLQIPRTPQGQVSEDD